MESYRGNIVSEPIPNSFAKNEAGEMLRRNIFMMDGTIVPGAPYVAATWYGPDTPVQEPHTHEFDEYLSFIGTDPEHPEDLGCKATLLLGDEWVTIEKSCVIFIPAGVKHTVFKNTDMRRPYISVTGLMTNSAYVKTENGVEKKMDKDGSFKAE